MSTTITPSPAAASAAASAKYTPFIGSSNDDLIEHIATTRGIVTSERIKQVMKSVDRAFFAPGTDPSIAYIDAPKQIGYGATISAPHVHGHTLQLLESYLHPGARALDIGCGSGIVVAYMSQLVGESGRVVGIEHIPELAQLAQDNLNKWDVTLLASDSERVVVYAGDGRLGDAARGPYQAICVGAAAPEVPQVLVDQLASPGRMIVPVGQSGPGLMQDLIQVDKDASGNVTETVLRVVKFVPLTDKDEQIASAVA
ncbi:protein-L-isoaspartate O-methyltransferase [Catenaria anguillulae PL171]|uniref:protein-L-isoaspartate(D-aspartate) O-methyltransferase n=1 Tax=Catenaria anguillulae PL171 TaxID=765915 RepID=A0A1Y2HQB7_9FUNG|nr:protein-L-isoaspartate O-methyltransferase [Catenaria anguillulae PL171]